MSYIEHSLDLSPAQKKKLANGEKVRISHKGLNGSHPAYLTKSQYNKIKKAYENNKGVDLQFSQKQVKHHISKGGSLWSDVRDFVKGKARDAYDLGRDKAEDLIELGKSHLSVPSLKEQAGKYGRKGADFVLDKAGNLIRGEVDKQLSKRGMGFIDDLQREAMKVAREQGQNLLRSGIDAGISKGSDLLNSQLKKRLGLGRPKKGKGVLSGVLGMMGLGRGEITDRRYREKFIVPKESQIADQSLNQQVQQGQKGGNLGLALAAPIALKMLGLGKKKKEKKGGNLGLALGVPIAMKMLGLGKKKEKKGEGFFDDVLGFAGNTANIARDVGMDVGRQVLLNKMLGKGKKRGKSGGSFKLP
jgi:hypothetical protein